jgi:hypothetical protein
MWAPTLHGRRRVGVQSNHLKPAQEGATEVCRHVQHHIIILRLVRTILVRGWVLATGL